MRFHRWLPPALAALAALLLAAPAGAATFNVTTLEDVDETTPDGDCTSCSLREAVEEARDTTEDDTIDIPPGDFVLDLGDLDLNAGSGKFTIVGRGARRTAIDGGDVDRVFSVPVNAVLELSSVTVRNGRGNVSGGGINSDGTVSLTDVAVVGNESGDGGGIASAGTLTLTRSLVRGNVATGRGGGIEATGLSLVNTTVSSNRSSGSGAGIWNHDGAVSLRNSTIASNGGEFGDGHGLDLEGAAATVANSVIAGNPNGDCRTSAGASIVSEGGNLAGDSECNFGAPLDPRLGPLADNGGQTDTHALLTGSPAIDTGTGPGCPGDDQRGVPRPQGQACDAGAFEAPPVAVTGPPADTVAPLVTRLTLSNPVFRVNLRGRAAQRRKAIPKGTRFRFRLSEPAGVSFAIARRVRGRRVGRTCRPLTERNRARPRCVRWIGVRRFVRARVAGRNSVPFSGRIRHGRKVRALTPGRYRVTVRASDAADNRSRAARVAFRVVR